MKLSPKQLHYLKKELIKLELDREWLHLQKTCPDLMSLLVPLATQQEQHVLMTTTQDLPFIRYFIQYVVQPFPIISCQTESQRLLFWSHWQLFLNEWYQRQPTTWMPPATQEAVERRAMISKLKKMMVLLLNKLIQCDELEASFYPWVMPSTTNETQLSPRDSDDQPLQQDIAYSINIISVQRLDAQKQSHRRLRRFFKSSTTPRQQTYFIIESKNMHHTDGNVSIAARRHCEFRKLAKKLESKYPERKDVPKVPAKLRNSGNADNLPWCEMDRRRLRAFLQRLASIPIYRHSAIFQQFLSPLKKSFLCPAVGDTENRGSDNNSDNDSHVDDDNDHDDEEEDEESDIDDDVDDDDDAKSARVTIGWDKTMFLDHDDVIYRRELDEALLLDKQKYQQHIDNTLVALDQELKQLKQFLFQPGGCVQLLDVIKTTAHWHELPPIMKKAFEWGRLCFAFTLHKQLVVSDLSVENRNQLKKTHAFMPYRTLATMMKISNPMRMMKGILDLFLARPFGGRSLMQRAILMNLQEEMNTLEKDILLMEKKLDPMICAKLYHAVITERVYQDEALEGLSAADALLLIMKHPDIEPALSPQQIQNIDFTDGRYNDKSRHWKEVHRLWHLYGKRQDQTQWMDLLMQDSTGALLQTVMGILYQPLAQVYQAADLGTTLYELKDFMDDLVLVVDNLQLHNHMPVSSLDTIQPFIDLVCRHQASFYRFVHKVHTQTESRLFTDMIAYMDSWLTRMQYAGEDGSISKAPKWKLENFWNQVNLDEDQENQLRKEIDDICTHHHARKKYMAEKRRWRILHMLSNQQQDGQEKSYDKSLDDDDDDSELESDDNSIYGERRSNILCSPLPCIVSSSGIIARKLLPVFIDQVMPLILSK